MRSCEEISRLVSESLDRNLPWHERLSVRLHLVMCRLCSRFQKQMLLLRNAARRHPNNLEGTKTTGPATLSPEARERMKRLLQDQP